MPFINIEKLKQIPVLGFFVKIIWGALVRILILKNKWDTHPYSLLTDVEKRHTILKYAQLANTKIFVETGTYKGLTTEYVSKYFNKCITIELNDLLYKKAVEKFKNTPSIIVYQGNSADVLPRVLNEIKESTLFWLDGHYCTEISSGKEDISPILQELQYIFNHPIQTHIILIDDARLFIGVGGYPSIRKLVQFVKKNTKCYELRIMNDMIIIYNQSETLVT